MLGGDIWWAQLWNKILITRGNHFKDFLKNSDTPVQLGFPWLSTTPQSHSKQPWVHLQCWQHCFEIFAIRSHAIVNCPLEVNDTIFKSTTFTCIIPINHLQPGYKYKFQSLAQFFFLIQAKSWSSIVLFYSKINCYNSQSNETYQPFPKTSSRLFMKIVICCLFVWGLLLFQKQWLFLEFNFFILPFNHTQNAMLVNCTNVSPLLYLLHLML